MDGLEKAFGLMSLTALVVEIPKDLCSIDLELADDFELDFFERVLLDSATGNMYREAAAPLIFLERKSWIGSQVNVLSDANAPCFR
jgi:hypothetical protein